MASPYYPSPTPSGVPPQPPQEKKKPIGMIILLLLVLLCVAAGVALAIMTLGEKSAPEAEAEAADPPNKVAAVPVNDGNNTPKPIIDPINLDGPDEIMITVETTPPGAEVFRAGESIGTTPINTTLSRSDEMETWQVFLDGYEVKEIEVTLDADYQGVIALDKVAPEAPSVKPKKIVKSDSTKDSTKGDSKKGDAKKDSDKSAKKKDKDKDKKKDKDEKKGTTRKVISGKTGAVLPD